MWHNFPPTYVKLCPYTLQIAGLPVMEAVILWKDWLVPWCLYTCFSRYTASAPLEHFSTIERPLAEILDWKNTVNAIILPYSKVITVDISRIMNLCAIDNEYHIVTNRLSRVLQIRGQQDFHYLLQSKHSFGVQRNAFKYGQPSVFIILRRFPRIDKRMLTPNTAADHTPHTHSHTITGSHTQTHRHQPTHPPTHTLHITMICCKCSGSKDSWNLMVGGSGL